MHLRTVVDVPSDLQISCLPTGPGGLRRGLARETQSSCSTVLIYSRPAIQLSLPVSTDFPAIFKRLGSCVSERPHHHFKKSAVLRKCLRAWFWPLHLTEGQSQCHVVFWQMHSVSHKTREGHASPLLETSFLYTYRRQSCGCWAVGLKQKPLESDSPEFKSQLDHAQAVWPWPCNLNPLNLNFPIYRSEQ